MPKQFPALKVRRSKIQGRGVIAGAPIPAGTRIIEYTGARMTHADAAARYDDLKMKRHHTFLFTIDDDWVLDAAKGGNDARYINHSCEPNCIASIDDGRVTIWSLRDIPAGEELSYDYWYTTDPEYSMEDRRRIYPCHCGTRSCR